MARRVKKRTQGGSKEGAQAQHEGKSIERAPKSMVIRIGAGEVGPSVSQLAKDVRKVMEPATASRLKERKGNKLRDYTTMCGPLGVTHLILFSRSETGNTNMRIAITPHGPTLHFRVDNYSLCKDIMKAMRHPRNDKNAYVNPPLLVMNNFLTQQNQPSQPNGTAKPAITKQLEQLCTTVFQSLFPPLKPQQTPLSSIKRVLLLNREPPSGKDQKQAEEGDEEDSKGPSTYALTLRHYAITTRPVGLSRAAKRLRTAEKRPASVTTSGNPHLIKPKKGRSLPNLGGLDDISEWLLNSGDPAAMGYTSASESEADMDAEVEVNLTEKRSLGKRGREREAAVAAAAVHHTEANPPPETSSSSTTSAPALSKTRVERRAIKLVELGPRLQLRLIKVEEGLCEGRVMWHHFVHKSPEELKEQELKWAQRVKEKEERRRVQKENVERKKKEKLTLKEKNRKEDGEEEGDRSGDDYDYSDIDDLEDGDLDELHGWKTDSEDEKDVDEGSDEGSDED